MSDDDDDGGNQPTTDGTIRSHEPAGDKDIQVNGRARADFGAIILAAKCFRR